MSGERKNDKTGGREDERVRELTIWFSDLALRDGLLSEPVDEIHPVSGDASFRRYFRAGDGASSFILMDAPPGKEDCSAFINVAQAWQARGINVPGIVASNPEMGFICLEDFGSRLYLDTLRAGDMDTANRLYGRAVTELLKIQAVRPGELTLPVYDADLLNRELALFENWFCYKLLGLRPVPAMTELLHQTFRFLIENALSQPVVCVHRDYHSRNLMDCGGGPPGVLDFQDAVYGPASYDLVSLLKDCYISWPRDQYLTWLGHYQMNAEETGVLPITDDEQFIRETDLMGVQRHLKAIGIFSRLLLRDGKPGYLSDIPRTLNYIIDLQGLYSGLDPFIDWCQRYIEPNIGRRLEQHLVEWS